MNVHGENAFVLTQRGNAYKVEKDYEKAMADYSEAIKINPEFRRAYEQRGYIYSLQENYGPAISDFKMALSLNPKSYIAWCSLGFNYRQTGDLEKSLTCLDEALSIHPMYFDARLNRGITLMNLQKMRNPVPICRKLYLWRYGKTTNSK
ncbi:MAG: tetratricopeptide repeat protein [Bacteroidales bacterium]